MARLSHDDLFIHQFHIHRPPLSLPLSLSRSFTDVFSLDSRLTRWWSIYVFSSSSWLGFHSTSLCNWRVYIKQPIDNDTSTFLTRFFFSISISILSKQQQRSMIFYFNRILPSLLTEAHNDVDVTITRRKERDIRQSLHLTIKLTSDGYDLTVNL